MSEIIIYEDPDITKPVQVTLEGETVWLTQSQMAELSQVKPQNVTMHLKNIYNGGELEEASTCKDFLQVQVEGARRVERSRKLYNLDAIISIGYRVNSKRGVRFRQWATSVLRQHLLQGYTLDQRRLAERGLDEARAALDLLSRTLEANALLSDTGQAVLELVRSYAKTWRLLLQYDEDSLPLPEGCQPSRGILDHDHAKSAIEGLKADLMARGEATDLFGRERGHGLAAILGAIEQTMFGEPLYPSREIKAAHLLYFVIKDHPFSDGNKRSRLLSFPALSAPGKHGPANRRRGPDRSGPAGGRKPAREQRPAGSSDRQPADGILKRYASHQEQMCVSKIRQAVRVEFTKPGII